MSETQRLTAGERLGARYELREERGQTPLCTRWGAVRRDGVRAEALIVEPVRAELDPRECERSLERARAFQHPHLRPLREVVVGDGIALLAYDPSDAPTLDLWMARAKAQGTPSLHAIRELFDQVCQAVAVTHREELAHGALAPWCVHVETRGGRPLVRVDALGVAAIASATEVERLPPELDPRAPTPSPRGDVYALGALLAAMLLGEDGSPGRLLQRLEHERPELDESLRALAKRCLEANPDARPADAAKVRELVRRSTWTARSLAPPRRPAQSAAQPPPSLERAAPTSPPQDQAPPPAPPPPPAPWSEETEQSALPAAPPPERRDDAEAGALGAATLRSPPRVAQRDVLAAQSDTTRSIEAPPRDDDPRDDAPLERTRAIALPPSEDPLEHTRAVQLPETPRVSLAPPTELAPEGDWDAPRSSFHVIRPSAPPPSMAPPPPVAPLPSGEAPASRASMVVGALALVVALTAVLVALTR